MSIQANKMEIIVSIIRTAFRTIDLIGSRLIFLLVDVITAVPFIIRSAQCLRFPDQDHDGSHGHIG
jgi:hypothetical protein